MKKQVLKYKVIRTMTKDEIIGMGFTRFTNKYAYIIIIALAVSFVSLLLLAHFMTDDMRIVQLLPPFIAVGAWFYFAFSSGQKLWMKIKDKEQPIDLDEV